MRDVFEVVFGVTRKLLAIGQLGVLHYKSPFKVMGAYVRNVLKNTTAICKDDLKGLEALKESTLDADLSGACQILRPLPTSRQLLLEVQFTAGYASLVQRVAELLLDLKQKERKDLQVSPHHVALVAEVRNRGIQFQSFVKQSVGDVKVFTNPGEGVPWMGVEMDVTQVHETLKLIDDTVSTYVQTWTEDVEQLIKLMKSYFPQGWEFFRNTLLAEENKALCDEMKGISAVYLKRIVNGCRILGTWLKLFKKLNATSGVFSVTVRRCSCISRTSKI